MKILVSGSSGLIGSRAVPFLESEGHEVWRLQRQPISGSQQIYWDPLAGMLDSDRLNGFAAVLHLAGENIAAGRWNRKRMHRIHASRVDGTTLLCERLAAAQQPPALLISASAVGAYGDRGEEPLDESSDLGQGFLAEVCADWEAACTPAQAAGIRVINLRMGMVLSPAGGALAKMLPFFRLGIGGVIGNGRQQISWIGIDDLMAILSFVLRSPELSGPINAVSPNPVTNRVFTKTLGRVLHRPTVLPLPALAVEVLFGRMGRELLLGGQRTRPVSLTAAGYQFQQPELEQALRRLLIPRGSGG